MTPDACHAHARYNRWMNEKLYEVAAQLPVAERKRDRGAFFKSIHGTLNHVLVADRIWMGRLNGDALEPGAMGPGGIRTLDQELSEDFDDLRRERALTDDAIERWVRELSSERLASSVRFQRRGSGYECPLWWVMTHFFNHQTHHRGQVTTLLRQAGQDPGVTDLFAMLDGEAAAARAGRTQGA